MQRWIDLNKLLTTAPKKITSLFLLRIFFYLCVFICVFIPWRLLQILSVTCTDDDAATILSYQMLSGDYGHFAISVQGDIIVDDGTFFQIIILIEFLFLFSFSRVFVILDWKMINEWLIDTAWKAVLNALIESFNIFLFPLPWWQFSTLTAD